MRKILVTGANGQIGSALVKLLGSRSIPVMRGECDMSSPESVEATLNLHSPDAIINAAAYTAVDKAEHETDLAEQINATAPGIMAAYAKQKNIPIVHYSTDYVFNGGGSEAWTETSQTDPINAYGRTKLNGEQAVAAHGGKHLIFRTSWVYDAYGKNFPNTMLRLAGERKEFKVVADQIGAPSYAPMLAEATVSALEKAVEMAAFPSGIYNLCNSGFTSWHGFACEIFEAAYAQCLISGAITVHQVASAEYPTPAKRPHNSRLDLAKLRAVFGIEMPNWKEGLAACMNEKISITRAVA